MTVNNYYAGFIPVEGVIAVLFPDLPGCNTQGRTMEQAFSRAREAISSYIEELINENYAIPFPSSNDIAFDKLKNILIKLGYENSIKDIVMYSVPFIDEFSCKFSYSVISYTEYIGLLIMPSDDDDINTLTVKNIELFTGVNLLS